MKIKFIVILLFALHASSFYAQKKIVDSIQIEILKTKEPSDFSNQLLRGVRFDSEKLKYVMVKCKVKSLNTKRAEISAFSLLDTVNKIRYRLGDYLGYGAIIGNPERNYFRKTKSSNNSFNAMNTATQYKANQIDQFDKYKFEGYTTFEIPVEFGTKKNPDQSIIYFGKTAYKDFKAELFFILPTELKTNTFNLYYKDSKIGIAKIE